MPPQRLVVIGTSSGGIEALRQLVAALPADFPAPICIVLHTSPHSPGMLDGILSHAGTLPARTASTGMKLSPGHIYVPPPDHHLLVQPTALCVARGPKENRFRPAIDPLFRSAAQVFGPAAVGVILTGNLDDGSAGLRTIKQLGGVAIVQDPSDALFSAMPANALRHVAADYVVKLSDVPRLLSEIVNSAIADRQPVHPPVGLDIEVAMAKEDKTVDGGVQEIGEPSVFACPDCHGVLFQLKDRGVLRFRCHTGHAYSAHSLLAAITEGIENAMWTALRAVEEGRLLLQHLSDHHHDLPTEPSALVREQLALTAAQAGQLREMVTASRVALTAADQ